MTAPVQETLFDIDEPGLDAVAPIEFVPIPLWLMKIATVDGDAKYVFSALLSMYGDPDDGKRLRVEYPPVSQEQLAVYLRLSPHIVKRCVGVLQEAHNCLRCRQRHALLRAERLGRSDAYRYRMVKCDSVEELLPLAPPPPRRLVVTPFQRRQLEAGLALAVAAESTDRADRAGGAPGEVRVVCAPAAADPKVGILREIQRYHKREVSPGVLETIAEQCFDGAAIAARLEAALDLVRERARHERRPVTPTFAQAVLEESRRAPAGFDPETFTDSVPREDHDRWELMRLMELIAMDERRPTLREARALLAKIRTLIVAHRGKDERQLRRLVEKVLTDPNVFGMQDRRRPKHPPAFLLAAVREGWILEDGYSNDGKLEKAFARLESRGTLKRAMEIATRHVVHGEALDRDALARAGVTSEEMRAYVVERARAAVAS